MLPSTSDPETNETGAHQPRPIIQSGRQALRRAGAAVATLGASAMRLAGALVVLLVAAGWLLYSGSFSAAVPEQENSAGEWLFRFALRRSVALAARDVVVPGLDSDARVRRGAALYVRSCQACHRAPGVERAGIANTLSPGPADLTSNVVRWEPAELFWIVKHGIRMSAMPAWGRLLDDDEVWDVVSFARLLPTMTVPEYVDFTAPASAARP